jgi:hypothetical protein
MPADDVPRARTATSAKPGGGTLRGHLYGVGGPAPGAQAPWAGTVTVTGSGFHRDIAVGPDGAYSLTLPPGSYTVVGHSPSYDDAAAPCPAPREAKITSGSSTTLDAICQMK